MKGMVHDDDVGLREQVEEFASDMRIGADSCAAVVKRARPCFREIDEIAHRVRGHRGMHRQHRRRRRQVRNRREIVHHVVRHAAVEKSIGHQRQRVDRDCVAIRRRTRDGFHPDIAGGAAAIFDYHLLPQQLGQPGADDPSDDIDAAAGRERRDQTNRLVRVIVGLRRSGAGQRESACQHRHQQDNYFHGSFSNDSCKLPRTTRRRQAITRRLAIARVPALRLSNAPTERDFEKTKEG
jgi:hypothetical protein